LLWKVGRNAEFDTEAREEGKAKKEESYILKKMREELGGVVK
jgi:hypothetical protein